jgi:nucleotide-binding universal stress UspA family protein
MGSHGRGLISEVFLGSASRGMAMLHSEAPLLLIPAARSGG